MNIDWKKCLGHAIAIVVFFVLVLIYFAPSIINGKVIQQGDTKNATGMSQELNEYYNKEGGISAWTGSMFSGMPSYHIYVHGQPTNYLTYVEKPIKSIDYYGGGMVFAGLICFYILMCVMGVNRWLAIAGSIAFAFASYNLIIIAAGHITKAYVIACMPLTLAGMVLLFRQRWLWGSVLFTIGVALSIMNNHLQITYYLVLFCVFFYLGFVFIKIKEKNFASLLKASGIMLACVLVAISPNIGNLYSNWEMSKESTRGTSELTQTESGTEKEASSGLDKDYAFMWSYGRGELLTLIVPNAYGGQTGGTVGPDSEVYKAMKSQNKQVGNNGVQTLTYWGDQPFTSGPVYFGALVCFLFLFGMIILKNPMKWWLAGASLFFILLSLGSNLESFNSFMFHHLPMYNKFRVPSMALVIPGMIFPAIGIWGMKELFTSGMDANKLRKAFIWSLSITGGLCLLLWVAPGLFLNFESALDANKQIPDWYYSALLQDRKSLASSDALRSLVFILLGGGLIFYFLSAKEKGNKAIIVSVGLAVLILADLWTVDKRYLNDGSFSREKIAESFKPGKANQIIMEDKAPSYRVLNLNNPFEDSYTSYFHKSIGGYHAVKLRRYQELIDHRLSKEISGNIIAGLQKATTLEEITPMLSECKSLNMLNTKYIIYSPDQAPIPNQSAYGNAWFVKDVKVVENADQEIAALDQIEPKETAVVDKRFADNLSGLSIIPDSTASIILNSYKPNILNYTSKASTEQLAVFSEIFYDHGWKAYIDGKLAPHFRTDWTLRALRIPAGEHQIEFKFIPDNYNRAMVLSSISSGIILLLLLFAVGFSFWGSKKKQGA